MQGSKAALRGPLQAVCWGRQNRGQIDVTMKVVVSIAGSDSSAGAGVQADLKSISANGGWWDFILRDSA